MTDTNVTDTNVTNTAEADPTATTDATETGAKAESTPEQKAQRGALRALSRALNKIEAGTPEEQKARWGENKSKYTADARKLVRALTKAGITMQIDEAAASKPKRGGGGGGGGGGAGKKGRRAAAKEAASAED